MQKFLTRLIIALTICIGFHFELTAQNSFSIPDTLFEFNKTTDFGVIHFYLEIHNDLNIDTTLRWKAHYSDQFPSQWEINFDDQNTNYWNVQEGDSADFTLFSNLSFPQKLIIGNQHQGFASIEDTVRFDIYHPDQPEHFESIYFVFHITEAEPASIPDNEEESLSCYPNPFIDEVFIKNACGEVQVYDALGRFIFNKKISDSKVDLSNIEKGKYWIRCSNSKPIPIIKR